MPIALYSPPSCLLHEMGGGHPEQPARLSNINDLLAKSTLADDIQQLDAVAATKEQLKAVHDPAYVDVIFDSAPSSGYLSLDGDTSMNCHSLEAALDAAGSVISAVDSVMGDNYKRAFCAVRPPGHHAEYDRAMGFCIFNNIAVGAGHAFNHHQLERIAIVDFDVHHGNGTEDIFFDNERLLFCSSFQHPFYPFSDANRTNEHIIKTPLPSGADGALFRDKISAQWLPVIDSFEPQLIMISAGFDAHREDFLANLNLREEDYQWVTEELVKLADTYSEGRIISVLEGGYDLSALSRSVLAHLQALT